MKYLIIKHILIILFIIQNTNVLMGDYANKYGIKYRIASNIDNHELDGLKNDSSSEKAIKLSDRGLVTTLSPPINFVFKENLFGDNFYGSLIFDYFLPYSVKDLPPRWNVNSGDKEIIRNYLNSEDKEICSFADDSTCQISADIYSSNVLFGYIVGGFVVTKLIDGFHLD